MPAAILARCLAAGTLTVAGLVLVYGIPGTAMSGLLILSAAALLVEG
jgi:hypothetical protein